MKRHWRFVRLEQLAVVTVCAMLFLVGCNLPPVGPINQASSQIATPVPITTVGTKPLHIVTIIEKADLLPCNAILVADVTVGVDGPSRWNTAVGKRPLLNGFPISVITQSGYRIYTEVQFSQLHPLFDRHTQPTHFFITIGGQVGQDQYPVLGYPQLQSGQRYLAIFTPWHDAQMAATSQQWLMVFDAYPIDAQGMINLPGPTGSAPNGEDIPSPPKKVSLNDFARQFAKCQDKEQA